MVKITSFSSRTNIGVSFCVFSKSFLLSLDAKLAWSPVPSSIAKVAGEFSYIMLCCSPFTLKSFQNFTFILDVILWKRKLIS